jgi:hypothetical protein
MQTQDVVEVVEPVNAGTAAVVASGSGFEVRGWRDARARSSARLGGLDRSACGRHLLCSETWVWLPDLVFNGYRFRTAEHPGRWVSGVMWQETQLRMKDPSRPGGPVRQCGRPGGHPGPCSPFALGGGVLPAYVEVDAEPVLPAWLGWMDESGGGD